MANLKTTALNQVQIHAPAKKMDYDIPYFGGLDTTTDPTALNEIDSPDTLNTVYDSARAVSSRKGYTKLLTTKLPSFVGGMYPLYQSTGIRQLFYASDTNFYIYNNAGGSTKITGVPANFTANQQWSFDEYMDDVYGGNGVDGLISYNGSTYSVANGAITPQFVCIHKNRVYCANANSSTLYFSDAGNPTSFPANNFIQINTQDGQNITGISELLDNLVIFKDESVWILTGEPLGAGNLTTIGNLQLQQANSAVGCTSFRSIQLVNQSLIFGHYSGLYILQNSNVTPLSPSLNATFKNNTNLDKSNLSWGLYSSREKKYLYGYCGPTSSTPDHVIVYDLITQEYSIWDDHPGGCAVNFRFSGYTPTVLMGDPTQGNIYELFQGYADIAGYTNTSPGATGGSTTTLIDTAASWTTNEFVDCKVMIGSNLGSYQTATVLSNTSNTLTFTSAIATAPVAGTPYSIGFYTSYWKSKIFDFGMVGYSKVYRFLNLFMDATTYPLLCGASVDFAPLTFQKSYNNVASGLVWGTGTWGTGTWGSNSSLFGQVNIGNVGRYVQAMFGNNLANQPWRCSHMSFMYKVKRERPNIVTT